LDQLAKINKQASHDEVVFFHVSNSSGLWLAPWLKRRRKLSFVHYCKGQSGCTERRLAMSEEEDQEEEKDDEDATWI
jgi:hypothetical protein